MTKVLGIDRMRAFAALSVAFAHLLGQQLPGPMKYLFTGAPSVFAFFVISGFCIHYPYTEKTMQVSAFFIGRVMRIGIPTLAAFLLAQAAGMTGYNFVDGYILWSVVCELWYYAMYPLFLIAARYVPFGWQTAIAFAVSYAVILTHGSDEYGNIHIYGPYLNWIVGLPAWLIGATVAQHRKFRASMPVWAWRLTVAATASGLYWLTMNTPVGYYLTLNLFAILVAFWMRAEIASAKSEGWLDKIGAACFSIYLFHVIFSEFTMVGVVVGCAVAYLLIERPSHLLARRLSKNFLLRLPSSAEGRSVSR